MSDRWLKCHQHINQSKSQKKLLPQRGRNSIFRQMSKGKQGNRTCIQNADIVRILCEGKVKCKVVLFCLLFIFPVQFIAFLVESLSSLQIGSQTIQHALNLSGAEVCKVSLGFSLCYAASLVESLLSSTFPSPVQRLSCLILVFCIKMFVMLSFFILELTYFINVCKTCRREVINTY